MTLFLILIGLVIIICVWLNHVTTRIGVPTLLAFIVLGIIFGNNGLIPIHVEDMDFAEQTCTVALIFIMFYGGFGTRWESAGRVAVESGLLASVGVMLTSGMVGVFCHYVLHWEWMDGLLLGSVIASTDAASVFSILRSRKLGLKNNTASLLEVESGSNDPFAYMLTMVILSLRNGTASGGGVAVMLVGQILFGVLGGWLMAIVAIYFFKKMRSRATAYGSLFVLAIAILSYALPTFIGGNGYLSAYLAGIIMGNADLKDKKNLVAFFDGTTGLMQVLIFFLLGLLARPAMMHRVIVPSLIIFGFMLLVARPLAVSIVLTPFRRSKGYRFRQRLLVSFVGLRGAASIVFAIIATGTATNLNIDLFNIVFCIVLLSILIQGSLLPAVAGWLDMIDNSVDVMKTFNDYLADTDIQFGRITITVGSAWEGKQIKELGLPKNLLIAMIMRDGQKVLPRGNTRIKAGDSVVIITKSFEDNHTFLEEHTVKPGGRWAGKRIMDYDRPDRGVVVMIRRAEKNIIPDGNTVLQVGDVLVLCHISQQEQTENS
jgi:cell volume regulation protein A